MVLLLLQNQSTDAAVGAGGGSGALPTVDAVTSVVGTVAGSVTGTLPSGTGDLLVAFVGGDNDNPATATGWTQIAYTTAGGTSADGCMTVLTAPSNVSSLVFSWSLDATRTG